MYKETIGYKILLSFQDYYKFDCNNTCFINSKHKLLKEKKICLDDCKNDITYKYEYNNQCYEHCPNGTHNSKNDNYTCFSEIISFSDNIYDSEEYNNSIIETYSLDKIDKINNDINNYLEVLFSLNNNESNIESKITNIINEIINGTFDTLILNKIEKNKEDILIKKENVIYQISSLYNQKYNSYNNISSIDFKECEKALRDHYNIDNNTSLFIFKIDFNIKDFLIPINRYQVFDLNEKNIRFNHMARYKNSYI